MSAAKVAYLFLATIAKPMATSIVTFAESRPPVSRATVAIAQQVYGIETKLKRALPDVQPDRSSLLTEARALEVGARFLTEATLFLIVAGVVVLESNRQSALVSQNEALRNQRLLAAEVAVSAREAEIGELKDQIRLLRAEVEVLRGQATVYPDLPLAREATARQ